MNRNLKSGLNSMTMTQQSGFSKNRPLSAVYSKNSKKFEATSIYGESLPRTRLPISSNPKAMKTLGQVNWTKQWFSKAYVATPKTAMQSQKEAEAVMDMLAKDSASKKAKPHKQLHLNERPPQGALTS